MSTVSAAALAEFHALVSSAFDLPPRATSPASCYSTSSIPFSPTHAPSSHRSPQSHISPYDLYFPPPPLAHLSPSPISPSHSSPAQSHTHTSSDADSALNLLPQPCSHSSSTIAFAPNPDPPMAVTHVLAVRPVPRTTTAARILRKVRSSASALITRPASTPTPVPPLPALPSPPLPNSLPGSLPHTRISTPPAPPPVPPLPSFFDVTAYRNQPPAPAYTRPAPRPLKQRGTVFGVEYGAAPVRKYSCDAGCMVGDGGRENYSRMDESYDKIINGAYSRLDGNVNYGGFDCDGYDDDAFVHPRAAPLPPPVRPFAAEAEVVPAYVFLRRGSATSSCTTTSTRSTSTIASRISSALTALPFRTRSRSKLNLHPLSSSAPPVPSRPSSSPFPPHLTSPSPFPPALSPDTDTYSPTSPTEPTWAVSTRSVPVWGASRTATGWAASKEWVQPDCVPSPGYTFGSPAPKSAHCAPTRAIPDTPSEDTPTDDISADTTPTTESVPTARKHNPAHRGSFAEFAESETRAEALAIGRVLTPECDPFAKGAISLALPGEGASMLQRRGEAAVQRRAATPRAVEGRARRAAYDGALLSSYSGTELSMYDGTASACDGGVPMYDASLYDYGRATPALYPRDTPSSYMRSASDSPAYEMPSSCEVYLASETRPLSPAFRLTPPANPPPMRPLPSIPGGVGHGIIDTQPTTRTSDVPLRLRSDAPAHAPAILPNGVRNPHVRVSMPDVPGMRARSPIGDSPHRRSSPRSPSAYSPHSPRTAYSPSTCSPQSSRIMRSRMSLPASPSTSSPSPFAFRQRFRLQERERERQASPFPLGGTWGSSAERGVEISFAKHALDEDMSPGSNEVHIDRLNEFRSRRPNSDQGLEIDGGEDELPLDDSFVLGHGLGFETGFGSPRSARLQQRRSLGSPMSSGLGSVLGSPDSRYAMGSPESESGRSMFLAASPYGLYDWPLPPRWRGEKDMREQESMADERKDENRGKQPVPGRSASMTLPSPPWSAESSYSAGSGSGGAGEDTMVQLAHDEQTDEEDSATAQTCSSTSQTFYSARSSITSGEV